MFKHIATVFLMINGQPFGEPQRLENRVEFPTLEECVAGKDFPPIIAAIEKLNAAIDANSPPNGSHTLSLDCEKAEKVDDGSI